MTDAPLRHGIVRTGFTATVRARAVRRAGSVVALVAGSTPERGQTAVVSLGAEAAAGHAAEVAASPEVDVVHICIRGEQVHDLPTFADGARAARITDEVVRSSRARTWVAVPA